MRCENEEAASRLVPPRRPTRISSRYAFDSTPDDRTPRVAPVAALRSYASALRLAASHRPSARRKAA